MERLTNQTRIKLSAHTITIKDEDGKTRGLIRGIDTFAEINKQPRRQFDAANNSKGAYRIIFVTQGAGAYSFTTDNGATWYYLTVDYSYLPDHDRERERCAVLSRSGVNIIKVKSRGVKA